MTDRAAIWAAIHTNLSGRPHGSDRAAITIATRATGCTPQQAWTVLHLASQRGWITSQTITGRRPYRRIALTDTAPAPTQKADA